MTIRFIHAADLHLDSPFKGLTYLPEHMKELVRESTFTAFSNLIEYAIQNPPDFLLIAGDIYDGEERSLRAQMKFQEGMEDLQKANIPVFICYGNHDHLQGSWTRFQLPSNVYEFPATVTTKTIDIRNQTIHLHGFSYEKRHILTPMIEAYPVAEQAHEIHIGLLHGSADGDASHAVYAPFTKAQLIEKKYDYWALGHIHKRQILHANPPIVYPGNIQGLHRKEQGEKGFYDVQLDVGQPVLTFVPTSTLLFETIQIDGQTIRHADELLDKCLAILTQHYDMVGPSIIELACTKLTKEVLSMFEEAPIKHWITVIRELVAQQNIPIAIHSLVLQSAHFDEQEQVFIKHVEETMGNWEEQDWATITQDIYQHVDAIKYIDRLSSEEFQEIEVRAKEILQAEMSKMK